MAKKMNNAMTWYFVLDDFVKSFVKAPCTAVNIHMVVCSDRSWHQIPVPYKRVPPFLM